MSNLIELKNLAYHEAGHVVIAWYYNLRITEVSISQQKDSAAHIIGHFGKIPVQAYQLERELDVAMAGAVAEEKVTGKKIKGWSGNDYINAVHMAAQWSELTGKSFDEAYLIDISIEVDQITGCLFSGAFLETFAAHVRQLMNRAHIWGCVEAVAQQLLKDNVLDGQEVTGLISKAWQEMDGDKQELILEKQRPDGIRRWGEWRSE